MPSHLTRTVFRRLLANEPIIHQGCLRRQCYSTRPGVPNGSTRRVRSSRAGASRVVAPQQQRRTLFGLGMFTKPREEAREANYAPGIEKMMEYAKMERMKARLPPKEDVADAFRLYVTSRSKKGVAAPITDTHAQLLLQSLNYCLPDGINGSTKGTGRFNFLAAEDLARAASLIGEGPAVSRYTQAHQDLAAAIHDCLCGEGVARDEYVSSFDTYVNVLTWTGRTEKARALLLEPQKHWLIKSNAEQNQNMWKLSLGISRRRRWARVLNGNILESNERGLQTTLSFFEDEKMVLGPALTSNVLKHRIEQGDMDLIKAWWERLRHASESWLKTSKHASHDYPSDTVSLLLQWCLRTQELDFGHGVVRNLLANNPSKQIWDAVLVWAAGTKKSVDDIGRMLGVMEESNASIPDKMQWRIPDSDTINALVEYAVSQDDPYMAERFIALGRDRGIEPNAKTFVLQMDYRLSVGDVDGALVAYKHLQSHDLSTNEDVPAVSRLVVALCQSQHHDFDTVMNVAADLSDRRVPFSPEMVSALTLLHLNRDEIHDVIDLLNTHVFNYTSSDRSHTRSTLLAYCLDPQTNTTRSWDAYTILRNIFDEMSRPDRTELMLNFFTRERPDMAVHVFNHMRTHSRADTIPTIETYVSAFLGCAKLRDLESLEVIHNQLKLDYNVNQSTYVRNALIAAYSACSRPQQALNYWDEIVASREGPTYNSIHIALRACEKSPFGDLKAQEIWTRLRKNKVDLDQSMWASYIAALAGNGDNALAIGQLDQAVEKGECEVDVFMLGSLLNAAPGQRKQSEVEEWAREKFVEVWEEMEKVGVDVEENGMRTVRIDRSVVP